MKSVELPAIRENKEDYDEIRKEIVALLRREFYLPLIRELGHPKKKLENAIHDLLSSIRAGRVRYEKGQFKGAFNSRISQELRDLGAEWDRKQGSWKIPSTKLSPEIQQAIAVSEERFKAVAAALEKRISGFLPEEIAEKLDATRILDSALFKIEKEFRGQYDRAGGEKKRKKRDPRTPAMEVSPVLSDEARAQFAEQYTNNLRTYVKSWAEEESLRLRKRVQSAVRAGGRYEELTREIQTSYGASLNKAKFLARQETSIMMSKFKQARYESAGSDEYVWTTVSGSPNHPVRPMHKALNGKTFRWADPPVVNEKGEKKHPGEDYGCRCVARPVIKF